MQNKLQIIYNVCEITSFFIMFAQLVRMIELFIQQPFNVMTALNKWYLWQVLVISAVTIPGITWSVWVLGMHPVITSQWIVITWSLCLTIPSSFPQAKSLGKPAGSKPWLDQYLIQDNLFNLNYLKYFCSTSLIQDSQTVIALLKYTARGKIGKIDNDWFLLFLRFYFSFGSVKVLNSLGDYYFCYLPLMHLSRAWLHQKVCLFVSFLI